MPPESTYEYLAGASNRDANPNQNVIRKITSNGISNFSQSVNTTANSLIFIYLLDRAGAGSLTTAYQGLFRNVCSGALMAAGVELSQAHGEQNFAKANEIVDASYLLTAILAVSSTIAYCATYFIFPTLFSPETADAASNYFLWAAAGNWPSLALVIVGQFAFQCGSWQSSMVSNIVYRIPAVILSYVFVRFAHLEKNGIGLGNCIAPWIAYVGMEYWWRRKNFQQLQLSRFQLSRAKKHFRALASTGAQMAFQRITEWGNVMAITLVLGRMMSGNLEIINPSLQLMSFLNLFSQGIGLAGNMLLKTIIGLLKKLGETREMTDTKIQEMQTAQADIKKITKQCLLTGTVIDGACAVALFFTKKHIANLFLPDNSSPSDHHVAETILWINGLGLLADAIRIISSNLLNAYDKILLPNVVSLFLMTIVGVPLSYGFEKAKWGDLVILMFSVRTAMIFFSAAINLYLLYRSIRADQIRIDALPMPAEAEEPARLIHINEAENDGKKLSNLSVSSEQAVPEGMGRLKRFKTTITSAGCRLFNRLLHRDAVPVSDISYSNAPTNTTIMPIVAT